MQDLLNVALVPLVFFALLLLVPLFYLFKFPFSPLITICKRNETLTGKVVLITGASSGIGEALAYEYARRGARLALVARREDRLREVLDKARRLVDHLVNNAGINQVKFFEEFSVNFSDLVPMMNVNFWGSVYATHFSVPHLRKSRGKIVVISSTAAWYPTPRLSFYNASKAATITFFETLRAEFGPDIGINIVAPGLIKSEMVTDQYTSQLDAQNLPVESAEKCAEAIVKSTCRGDLYLIEPFWFRIGIWLKWFFPGLLEWLFHFRFEKKMSTDAAAKINN